MVYSVFLVLAPFTGAILLVLLIIILQRTANESAKYLALFVGAAFGYLVSNYLQLVSASPAWTTFWAEVEHFTADLISVAWLLFVFDFAELTAWKRFRRWWPLCVPGIVDLGLTVTNPYHHLIWRSVAFAPIGRHLAMNVQHGGAFFAVAFLDYAMIFAGLLVLQRQLRGSFGIYRRQLIMIFAAILVPLILNAVYISAAIPGFHKDFTPIGFGVAAIICVIAILNARFLEVIPASRGQIFNVLNDGIVVLDGKRHIIDMNRRAMTMLGLDETTLGRSAAECSPISQLLEEWDPSSEALTKDVTLRRDDQELHYEMHLRKRSSGGLKNASAIIGIHDITERIRLERNEVLLKEIHHRVKNSLQVISSLLYLQEDRIADEELQDVLRDCRTQIQSMALIHEDLYHSQDSGSVDFGRFIQTLLPRLFSAYRVSRRVTLRFSLGSVHLGIETAIPCGLIVNELCVNVLKHAFPPAGGPDEPELRVELSEEADWVHVVVADNGIGISPDFQALQSSSLGVQIVSTLAKQLHGTIQFERDHGTRSTLTFPIHTESRSVAEDGFDLGVDG